MSILHATILTVFPEMFPGTLGHSLAGQALNKNIWSYDVINIRDFGLTKHKNIDDEAYGGGNGLIMRPDVLGSSIDHALALNPNAEMYYPSPRGRVFTQSFAKEMLKNKNLIFLCGRYEGIDERVIEEYNVKEISVGDYILSGGEIPTLTILDCLIRLLPGVLMNQNTLSSESFEEDGAFKGGLECSLYTRPAIWRDRAVPSVLLSGNHRLINEWKKEQSHMITKLRRPELLKDL
ncbi:tRNA (guanosine(37)-N1)-methyltransferase TrmD [Rickettsia conorii subsp. heilongjiangensis]|uniref:tRNA (guanine-N(1)-)-methyltransferase n=1 Tax=Rickettsia conorii subsp. heilongjiangensis TaxID=226665 RepID=A0AAD1GHT7_RICCR|nr:tRNA (guanosine(37)-N1)-methyltransferase TrmD [Rickettsia conorii]AEK74191.1 tRNA (guanine-N(1)-)-methyltransferase [Rickettsia conorii subsp. heilongjiangensis 054]BBM90979.1 tRNA (guanosine(37)-N1)-methyltransferase TrmD [Rickettsia conorii subsp. heilongjiangensis]BBM92188.1 tRNA (guanosine(37)-N1)-methyltransferase TrmD [Rickettsia conorii subsp. heilongjiangensis]BBM93397.1 tRNA (guanosine(37)-N1)-methyltransferase TrmD [Rickettsia conorii subsp. heilongjiangensis]BBM94606.1 tRNA (gua